MDVEELTDIFYTSDKKGQVCRVKLNGLGFTLQRESSNGRSREQLIDLEDIVGSRCIVVKKDRRACSMLCSYAMQTDGNRSDSGDDTKKKSNHVIYEHTDASAYLYVFAYILNKKHFRNIIRRERTVLKLRFRSFDTFGDNMREAERWYHTVRAFKGHSLGNKGSTDERRILVLLNPKSGSGKAREIFNRQVVPVLNESEQAYDLHVTKHANYAREFVRVKVLDNYSGIVAVGGDGLFFEILNGLLMRADWLEARNIPLGIVPCGSGNGLARSVAHVCGEPYEPKPILGATLTMLSGKSLAMDVVRIQQQNQILYSFLSVGWGLISDIDIESERLRSLGYQRFTIWTLHRLISLRTYRGKISYLPKENVYMESDTISLADPLPLKHSRSCNTCLNKLTNGCFQSSDCIEANKYYDVISLQNSFNPSLHSRCDSWFSPGSCRSTYYSVSESIYHSVEGDSDDGADSRLQLSNLSVHLCGPTGNAPPLDEPVPSSWIVEEGEFVMVQAAYQTHLGSDCYFVPQAKFNDGIIYVVIIRSGISRAQLLNFLIGMSSGTHVSVTNNDYVKMVPVTALRIEPYENDGILTVDGERIEFGPLQAEILPGMVRVMTPK